MSQARRTRRARGRCPLRSSVSRRCRSKSPDPSQMKKGKATGFGRLSFFLRGRLRLAIRVASPEYERAAGRRIVQLGGHQRGPRVELESHELLGENLVEVRWVGAWERVDPQTVADHRGVARRGRFRR